MLPTLLLASKCDLPHRQVEINEIESLCQALNFMSWIEVSAKEHLMIEDSMNFLIDRIVCSSRLEQASRTSVQADLSSIRLVAEGVEVKDLVEADKVSGPYCWC